MDIIQSTDFNQQHFLSNFWQKKPLLIKGYFEHFSGPLSPEELAGLSMEEQVESRIVVEHYEKDGCQKNSNSQPAQWDLKVGPFFHDDFKSLPETHCTLLVQGADHWIPSVCNLVSNFHFLPQSIFDDVMVSYATDQGSVGPHFDHYDVFLIQGMGRRQWKVGKHCSETTPLIENCILSLLTDMGEITECLLEPGDVLYLPPQIAHRGTSQGESMSYSIGFRSPNIGECLASLHNSDEQQEVSEFKRLKIPLPEHDNTASLDQTLINAIKEQLPIKKKSDAELLNWFGLFSTEPKYDSILHRPDSDFNIESFMAAVDNNESVLYRNEGSRFLHSNLYGQWLLFVDGNKMICTHSSYEFAKKLCYQTKTGTHEIKEVIQRSSGKETVLLLLSLINQGSLYFE